MVKNNSHLWNTAKKAVYGTAFVVLVFAGLLALNQNFDKTLTGHATASDPKCYQFAEQGGYLDRSDYSTLCPQSTIRSTAKVDAKTGDSLSLNLNGVKFDMLNSCIGKNLTTCFMHIQEIKQECTNLASNDEKAKNLCELQARTHFCFWQHGYVDENGDLSISGNKWDRCLYFNTYVTKNKEIYYGREGCRAIESTRFRLFVGRILGMAKDDRAKCFESFGFAERLSCSPSGSPSCPYLGIKN